MTAVTPTRARVGAEQRGDDAARPGEEFERAAEYCAWIEQERELTPELTLAAAAGARDRARRPRARLRAGEDGERRLANVRKLVELAREWERSEGRDLRGFLDEAAFQQGGGPAGVSRARKRSPSPTRPWRTRPGTRCG